MQKRRGWALALLAVAVLGTAGFWVVRRQPLARIVPVRERLLDTLSVTGTARFRDEAMGPDGVLCGQVANVNGGERIGGAPGVGTGAAGAGPRWTALDGGQWRRFIVVPAVPAFYVEGLAPWGLSLDGRKIAVDALDLEQERAGFVEQYAAAAEGSDAAMDPDRTAREIAIKTLDEHFEVRWARYCPPRP